MIVRYLLSILFLSIIFWSCEEETLPEDCAGVEGGSALVDSCGVCDDDPANNCTKDCSGQWGVVNVCGCTDSTAINFDSTATFDDGSCILQIEITYNIHESLPADWITEFYVIMNNLLNIIPSYQNYFNSITVYAWNDNIDDPYQGIEGGAYVGTKNGLPIMVLEIPNSEFTYNHIHRYSVIAHEYFHIYQRNLSEPMNYYTYRIKWLIEGAAASFEAIYIRNHYHYNYFSQQSDIDSMVITDPSVFESYDSNNIDVNYSSSVFMTLVLAKELINLNYSEEDAFKLIYKDFMLAEPTNLNWETTFESVFNITVGDFYESLKTYPIDIYEVLPNESLTIEQIFD
tara:strand:+ start:1778 stop:2806 length:1029 start_codon:yes stop_codon:yes gene_type:complete